VGRVGRGGDGALTELPQEAFEGGAELVAVDTDQPFGAVADHPDAECDPRTEIGAS